MRILKFDRYLFDIGLTLGWTKSFALSFNGSHFSRVQFCTVHQRTSNQPKSSLSLQFWEHLEGKSVKLALQKVPLQVQSLHCHSLTLTGNDKQLGKKQRNLRTYISTFVLAHSTSEPNLAKTEMQDSACKQTIGGRFRSGFIG